MFSTVIGRFAYCLSFMFYVFLCAISLTREDKIYFTTSRVSMFKLNDVIAKRITIKSSADVSIQYGLYYNDAVKLQKSRIRFYCCVIYALGYIYVSLRNNNESS